MPRRPVTPRVRAAARRNIKKAQVSRIRTREPRQLGRKKPLRQRPPPRLPMGRVPRRR